MATLPGVPENLENLPILRRFLELFRAGIGEAIDNAGGGGGGGTGDIKSDGTVSFAANESMGGNKITNVGTPTLSGDAANKAYVDAKKDVYAATRVVDSSGNGTDTLLEDALANLPAEGGTIFIKDASITVGSLGGAVVGATLANTFASAPTITGANGTFAAGSTVGFTKEAGEPNHAGNGGGKSGWLKWVAPANGTCVIDLSGSTFDTIMGIYTGSAVNSLVTITSDDDSGAGATSRVSFSAVGGTTYRIAVDGFGGDSGTVTITMSLVSATTPYILPNKPVTILGAGIDATTINYGGGGSLFSSSHGQYFTLKNILIEGGSISAAQTFFTSTATGLEAYLDSVEINGLNHIIEDTGGTSNTFTFTGCEMNLPAIDLTSSFYRGVSTATVIWNYTSVTLAEASRIAVNSGGAFLGSPKCVMDHSYIGGPPPSSISDFVIGQAIFDGVRADAIKFTISGALSQIYGLESKDCIIALSGNDFFIDHSFFHRVNGIGGSSIAFITTSSCDEIHIANSTFDGAGQDNISGVRLAGITRLNITGNRFRNLPADGVFLNLAAIGAVTGNTFSVSTHSVESTNGASAVVYTGNAGLLGNATFASGSDLRDAANNT